MAQPTRGIVRAWLVQLRMLGIAIFQQLLGLPQIQTGQPKDGFWPLEKMILLKIMF